jgi:hypothetical protein
MVMRVINLAGAPGAGKSTTAAGLFNLMKLKGFKVELVTEFAKELTYDKAHGTLSNQLLVFAEQEHRIRRLYQTKQVDYVITDSPLFLSLVYADTREFGEWFTRAVLEVNSKYLNSYWIVDRVKPYQEFGRNQTEAQAKELDSRIANLTMTVSGHTARHVSGDEMASRIIFEELFGELRSFE